MMDETKAREKIIKEYRRAFVIGSDTAWRKYHKILGKIAKEVDADSPEALEDWAFNTAADANILS